MVVALTVCYVVFLGGWVLLMGSFILGIIALVRKGEKEKQKVFRISEKLLIMGGLMTYTCLSLAFILVNKSIY